MSFRLILSIVLLILLIFFIVLTIIAHFYNPGVLVIVKLYYFDGDKIINRTDSQWMDRSLEKYPTNMNPHIEKKFHILEINY